MLLPPLTRLIPVSTRFAALVLALALGFAGCVTSRNAIHLDEDFKAQPGEKILFFPVLDARADQYDHVLVSRNVRDAMVLFVREKEYFVTQEREFAVQPSADFSNLEVAQFVELAPPGVKTPLLFVQVEKVQRELEELGETVTVTLSGYLVDPVRGVLLWQDRALGSSALNGLLVALSRGSIQYEASVNAARSLVSTMPSRSEVLPN